MNPKDVNDYLQQTMSGAPEMRAEEKKEFLGVFKERVYLTMTIKEMKSALYGRYFEKQLLIKPGGTIRINAQIDSQLRLTYMMKAQQKNISFTIIDSENTTVPDSIGLVYHFDQAIHEPILSVSERYARK